MLRGAFKPFALVFTISTKAHMTILVYDFP